MLVSEIITQGRVISLTSVSSKKRLFQEIANGLTSSCGLNTETIFNALQDREQLGPTGMGNGIAIPHAKVDGIKIIHGLFIRLEKPVDFEAMDKKKVDLIFGIVAPRSSSVDHLKALAKVSRLLRDKNICSKLRSTEDKSALFSILTQDWDIKAA
ncbi:MAG: PTS lactose transporter subunit IIC [Rhodobacteraceae bacterium]|nr:MAG: PTS lactose transporter subunit IIC [Paracoccaceae bacterium]